MRRTLSRRTCRDERRGSLRELVARAPRRARAQTANPGVGTRLLLEDEDARHWEIRLAPGERIGFHRHVLDYVWTCVSGGLAISHDGDGETLDVSYEVGETPRFRSPRASR